MVVKQTAIQVLRRDTTRSVTRARLYPNAPWCGARTRRECIDRNSRHTTEARLATAARRRFDNVAVCCIVLRAHKRYRVGDRNASPGDRVHLAAAHR